MICLKGTSKYQSPKILWYQSDTTVTIRILLQDVEDYFLRVEYDHMLFSTTANSEKYYSVLYFFGIVTPEKTTHRNTGREIKVTLEKTYKGAEWYRLCLSREKNPLIKVDPDHIYKKDWILESINSMERESFAEYKRKNDITQIMPLVPSSDEEESEDELMDEAMFL